MNLRESAPQAVTGKLNELKLAPAEVLLSVATDINAAGGYDEQWLIVTSSHLLVFDPQHGSDPLFHFRLNEVSGFRIVHAVGSGILQIQCDGIWLDFVRFSNRLKFQFDRVLKRLLQLKAGEALLPAEADAKDPQRCPQCDLMLEFAGEICPRCIDHGAALSRVTQMMKPYWRAAAVLVALLAVGISLDMAWPLLTRYLVDHVLVGKTAAAEQPIRQLASYDPLTLLVMVVAALAGVQVVRGFVNVLTGRISGRVGNALTFDVRGQLVQKLEQLGLAYYNKQDTGSLVGRIAYDTEAIQSFINQVTSGFLMQFFLVIISFVMMFTLNPALAFWSIVPAPLVIAGAYVYWRYMHPRYQRNWDRSSKQASVLNGILSGIRVVKAFGQEENEFKRFQSASRDVRDSRQELERTGAFFYPLMGVVFQIGGWIIWYVGGENVLQEQMSLGTLMAFFGYLAMFYGPLGHLTNLTTWLTQFSTQMHRIFEILDTPTIIPEAQNPVKVEKRHGEIEFRDVTFGYSRGAPVLKNLNFTIQPGEKIGIVGRSGSGKTSLTNLIARFYDVDSGQILLDGVDIRQIEKHDLRSRISMVLQEPFLFRGALHENVTYGKPKASMEDVISATRAANAHDFIMNHPLAYETPVGERGSELSGGERQRISIARALLCNSPILILDEATASIDSESELSIQMALEDAAKDRTTIIIAHRLSTLQDCDKILVIENGGIAETGNHRELMKLDGRYAEWVRIQQGKVYIEMDADGNAINDARKRKLAAATPGPELSPIDGHLPRWLRPGLDQIEMSAHRGLQLHVKGEKTYRGVFALRCFPIHHQEEYISLRHVNEDNRVQEIGLIRDLAQWPPEVQKRVRDSLSRRYFFHTIQRLHSIRKFAQFLAFTAQTENGKVEFITRYSPEAAQEFGKTGKLLMDVEDNMYVIPDLALMARADREVFDRYIYW